MKFPKLLLLSLLAPLVASTGITEEKIDVASPEISNELHYSNGVINLDVVNQELEKCQVVQELNRQKAKAFEEEHAESGGSLISHVFSLLFPFENPAWNALLATTYISGPPNLILGFIPASINPSKLSLLVSFAIGGLLGDVFLHLLPQTFVGEPVDHRKESFVLVDERRNVILGLLIFVGFIAFFFIDKGLRILQHEQGVESSHSHDHSHAISTSVSKEVDESDADLRKRKKTDGDHINDSNIPVIKNPNASIKASAYLNLISDFTHNITDGLAISASFYISKNVGSTTCLAVFFHEIPHEVGDFALLIQGGFTKWQAMSSQFLTALGAYLGTVLGIFLQELANSTEASTIGQSTGLFGTSVTTGDLTLPFTAGGFLYIATVGVIPEVLELDSENSRKRELLNGFLQLLFVFIGIALMFLISWFE